MMKKLILLVAYFLPQIEYNFFLNEPLSVKIIIYKHVKAISKLQKIISSNLSEFNILLICYSDIPPPSNPAQLPPMKFKYYIGFKDLILASPGARESGVVANNIFCCYLLTHPIFLNLNITDTIFSTAVVLDLIWYSN